VGGGWKEGGECRPTTGAPPPKTPHEYENRVTMEVGGYRR